MSNKFRSELLLLGHKFIAQREHPWQVGEYELLSPLSLVGLEGVS